MVEDKSQIAAMLQSGMGMVANAPSTPPSKSSNEDPKPKKPLSPQERQEWNAFIRFVKDKGMSGSKDLDKRDKNLGASLFDEFKAANPNTSISYDIVPRAQEEFLEFQRLHKGLKERKGVKVDDQFEKLSPADGWFGSITSQQELIPFVEQTVKGETGEVISTKNKGLMGGLASPLHIMRNGVPVVVGGRKQPVKLQDGWYVEDDNGYLVPLEQYNRMKSKTTK
jgi:hypothetical protein